MSFVITPISRKITVQVSDTRITSFGGKSVLSETQRKTLVVLGSQARFVVGWVGMALDATYRHNTGEWLYETLRDMDAVSLTIDEIADRLESLATAYVAQLTAGNKRLVFVMTGWQDYNEVWDQPLVKLAQKYGISDVRVGKVCRKLRIPLPGRGYWAKRNARKPVGQLPLAPFEHAPMVRRISDVILEVVFTLLERQSRNRFLPVADR